MTKFSSFNHLRYTIMVFLLFTNIVFTQNLDSLRNEWDKSGSDLKKRLEISSKISDLYFNVQLDSLKKYSEIQLELAKKLNDYQEMCSGYMNLGTIYFRKGNLTKAMYFYNKTFDIAEERGFTRVKMSVSANIASINLLQSKNIAALRNYFIAKNSLLELKEYGEISYREALLYEAQLNNNIGIAYFKMNDYKNASRFYAMALTVAEQETKDSLTLGKVYTNLGEIELKEGNYNVAQNFLFKGKRIKERIGDSMALQVNYNLIGSLYLEIGDLKKAKENFDVTKKLLKKYEDQQLEKGLAINFSKYYLRLNDVDRSIVYLLRAKRLNSEEYTLANEIEINQLLSEAYFLKKDFNKSNLYREIYEGIRDSMYNSRQGLEIARMELYYNIANQNLKDSLEVQRENLKKGEEIHLKEVQNFYLILWLVFLAIAFGAIVYVLNIVRKRNKELQKSVVEKEALMKEVHHRVKNNFQIISSLLNIQANKLKTKKFVGPMLNMQNRIIAMSLVHEKLYVSDFQEAVNADEYFNDLLDSISRSLLSKKSKVQVINKGEDFMVSLEKAIPLGLIVNELITNSIKYGAKEGEEVQIDLEIVKNDNEVTIILQDYGNGFPEDFNSESYTESIGLELVNVLIEQLDGEISFSNEKGARVVLKFNIE